MTAGPRADDGGWAGVFLRSFAAKTALLVIVFLAVPAIVYDQFRDADADKRRLLLESLQTQAHIIGESLRPRLAAFDGASARGIDRAVQRLSAARGLKVKLLLRPRGQGAAAGFYYIAAGPPVPSDYLEEERAELLKTGVLEKLADTCAGDRPLAVRYVNPAGEEEVLTAIAPVNTEAGCWVVITSVDTEARLGSVLGTPYWQTPEVQIAAVIYVGMALLVLSMFAGVWRNLLRFAGAARHIRTRRGAAGARSFAALNRIPELAGVAAEFDRMVETLQASAHALRRAAEDNAHAFKTPIATIAQSLEPVRRAVPQGDGRARRAVELIERALQRLDALVGAARRMDEATAELLQPPDERIDLSALVENVLVGYGEVFDGKRLAVERDIAPGIAVRAGEALLETVLENLLDNAADFSPAGGRLQVRLAAEGREAVLTVADEGPGVPADRLERIFERYHSTRTRDEMAADGGQHFGIGLWLVRRNVEAIGGRIRAEAREPRGLAMVVRLPRAR